MILGVPMITLVSNPPIDTPYVASPAYPPRCHDVHQTAILFFVTLVAGRRKLGRPSRGSLQAGWVDGGTS